MPRVLTVVGNRPQFVKAAAVSRHLRALVEETLVHSGQHYDRELSAVFFEELGLPAPDLDLAVGSGSHAEQTAAALAALEPLIARDRPDAVLVYGDTNTTLAGSLAAAKLQVPVVHVEAGMRSFDLAMPEEVNRLVADHVSDLLLCSTETAMENLGAEGLGERAALVGDTMADVALDFGPLADRRSEILGRLGVEAGAYLVATLHRPGTVDVPETLARAVEALLAAAEGHGPLVFPVHPRTRARLDGGDGLERLRASGGVLVTEPLGYLDFARLIRAAAAVITDSGGVQKEAYLGSTPCLTLRAETEWVETLERGWNRLVEVDPEAVLHALDELASSPPEDADPGLFGDGRAGERCAIEVARFLGGA